MYDNVHEYLYYPYVYTGNTHIRMSTCMYMKIFSQ